MQETAFPRTLRAMTPLPISAGLFMYPEQPADSHMATMVRTPWDCLQVWKELVGFFVESTFPPARKKPGLFADYTTPHLLRDIYFVPSPQQGTKVGNKKNLLPSQLAHTSWHIPACHKIICGAFYIPVLFTPSQTLRTFPLKNSAVPYFLCFSSSLLSTLSLHWQCGFT